MVDSSHVDLKLTKFDEPNQIYYCPMEEYKINGNEISLTNMKDKNNCITKAMRDFKFKF